MTSRIPALLSPYLTVPRERGSLTLFTGVLSATTNWLVLLYLHSILHPASLGRASEASQPLTVILVSWLRDWEFWKTEARRTAVSSLFPVLYVHWHSGRCLAMRARLTECQGLDLAKLAQCGQLVFIDGLDSGKSTASPTPPQTPPSPNFRSQAQSQPQSDSHSSSSSPYSFLNTIRSTVSSLPQTYNAVLILDHPHLLLIDPPSLPSPHNSLSTSPSSTSTHLPTQILSLRSHPKLHATLITAPADTPFLSASSHALSSSTLPPSSFNSSTMSSNAYPNLETETAALTVTLAHQARCILSLRPLDTGWAGDVSGVIRAVRGGGAFDTDGRALEEVELDEDIDEGEWLYLVRGDGGVRVWRRGEGAAS